MSVCCLYCLGHLGSDAWMTDMDCEKQQSGSKVRGAGSGSERRAFAFIVGTNAEQAIDIDKTLGKPRPVDKSVESLDEFLLVVFEEQHRFAGFRAVIDLDDFFLIRPLVALLLGRFHVFF